MVHPCIPDAGNGKPLVLHACEAGSTSLTICGEAVTPGSLDQRSGAKKLCRTCYPVDVVPSNPVDIGDKQDAGGGS